MAVLGSRFYVTADGGAPVDSVTHPETGERVWSCSSCEAQGKGEANGRDHATTCSTTARTTFQYHYFN